MNNISETVLIIKKEMKKFLRNKRLLFSTLIMPGLVIAIIYSILGNIMEKEERMSSSLNETIYVVDIPKEIELLFRESDIKYKNAYKKISFIKSEIQNKREVLLVIFPKTFDIKRYSKNSLCPNIEIYYNASSNISLKAYSFIIETLNAYEDSLSNVFNINYGEKKYNLASESESIGRNVAMILPTLLMGLIFASCLSITAESIAGEKERGTISTILVTTIGRGNLAAGKIISLSIMALGSAVSSYIGTLYALPIFIDTSGEELIQVYDIKDYMFLLMTLFSSIILIVSIMSIFSARAQTIREASAFLSPFSAVIMLVSMTCIIQEGVMREHWIYLIPLYNNIQGIYNVLNFEIDYKNFIIMFIFNMIYSFVCIFILKKMLNSEKMMFE